jgi:hypothetical protein
MLRVYRSLLYLYPAFVRAELGDEMTSVFLQAESDIAHRRILARAGFFLREISGLIAGALRAHVLSLFGSDWVPLRRFTMRPEFRFPRSTVFLMCVILAGVVLAIEKAKTVVEMKEGVASGAAGTLDPMFWSVLFILAIVFAVVAAVWGVLFALHRTGMHRLGDVQTWPDQR